MNTYEINNALARKVDKYEFDSMSSTLARQVGHLKDEVKSLRENNERLSNNLQMQRSVLENLLQYLIDSEKFEDANVDYLINLRY